MPIDKSIIDETNSVIMQTITLDPVHPLNYHVADSDQMAIDNLNQILTEDHIIVVQEARIRHKIAYQCNLPISSFAFLRDGVCTIDSNNTKRKIILWDYMNLSQPAAGDLVYGDWDQVDLILILRNLVAPGGVANIGLHDLVLPTG
jgi:hypothetical protein